MVERRVAPSYLVGYTPLPEYQLGRIATAHIRKYYRRKRLVALRVTGTKGLSGYWQAYTPLPGGVLSSYGRAFHVS